MMNDGTCLFDTSFYPMPESALITAMISAMQAFIKEVSGSHAKKLSTGGFVFHLDRVGKIVFILATDDDERPESEIYQLRTRFLHKFGGNLHSFSGMTDEYLPFEEDVYDIFNIQVQEHRVEPSQQLNSFALIQIPSHLQEVARTIVMKKEISTIDLYKELDDTPFQINNKVEELVEMGYIGRYFDGNQKVYFV